jgi:hypothetical protein
MKTAFIFLATIFTVTFSSDQTPLTVKEGQSVDGLQLEKSTIVNASDKYGKEYKFIEGIIDYEDQAAVHINRFYFSNGIIAISLTEEGSEQEKNLRKSVIAEIGILYPTNATTDKGVSLKTDKLEKILKIYGQPEKQKTWQNNKDLHYYSKGISFCCNNEDNHIEKIAIYRNGREPDFSYWNAD